MPSFLCNSYLLDPTICNVPGVYVPCGRHIVGSRADTKWSKVMGSNLPSLANEYNAEVRLELDLALCLHCEPPDSQVLLLQLCSGFYLHRYVNAVVYNPSTPKHNQAQSNYSTPVDRPR